MWRSSAVRFWSIAALIFLLLCLGPTVRLNGRDTSIPGPFALISQIPFFEGNRYPSRYSVMFVLSLSILAAFGLGVLMRGDAGDGQRRPRGWLRARPLLAAAAVTLVLFEHLSVPLPLSDMRIPAVYEEIASEQGDLAVLELPIGWRNGGRVLGQQDVVIMFEQWYQTAHGGRLLGGNTSRNPEFKFQYFAQAPLLSSIIGVQNGRAIPPDVRSADQAAATDILAFLGVQYVVLHQPPASPELVAYAEEVLPLVDVAEEDDVSLYRVTTAPEGAARIDLGTPLGRLHLAEGWSPVTDSVQGEPAVWAQRRQVRLLASLTGAEERLRFRAWTPRRGQSVEMWAAGRRWWTVDLNAGWGEYEISLPDGGVQPGLNSLQLRFSDMFPLADLGGSPGEIAGQASVSSIVVQSAGLETGGNELAHVFVDGEDLSPNQRGYNLVALSPTGEYLLSEAFDTHMDPLASQDLARAISGLPEGSVVALAVADEASLNLTEEAVAALSSVGAVGDLRERFRWNHAIIGMKGASPGQALEAQAVLQPSLVYTGIGATAPAVAAAFSEFEFAAPR